MWFRTHVSTITNSLSLAKLLYIITKFSFSDHCCTFIIYKVYLMRMSATKLLSSLSLGLERKVQCYNKCFFNGYVFHTKEYGYGRKIYNNGVCVNGSTCSELEVDYYGRLEEVVELQYHSEHNGVFLFKCYWYAPLTEELELILTMVWSKSTQS